MSSISQCRYEISRYNSLKSSINSVISSLSSASGSADDLSYEIKDKYKLNDNSTPIVDRTIELKENIENTSNFLSNKVIPAIDSAIYSLYREIERLEAEERARREAEEKAKKEAEEKAKKEAEEKAKK